MVPEESEINSGVGKVHDSLGKFIICCVCVVQCEMLICNGVDSVWCTWKKNEKTNKFLKKQKRKNYDYLVSYLIWFWVFSLYYHCFKTSILFLNYSEDYFICFAALLIVSLRARWEVPVMMLLLLLWLLLNMLLVLLNLAIITIPSHHSKVDFVVH